MEIDDGGNSPIDGRLFAYETCVLTHVKKNILPSSVGNIYSNRFFLFYTLADLLDFRVTGGTVWRFHL